MTREQCVCVPDPFPATNFSEKSAGLRLIILCYGCMLAAGLNCLSAQDAVLTIPGRPEWPDSGSSFDGSNESHRDQMWKCRVALLFRCTFKRPGPHEPIPCVLAIVNRLREFEARKQLSLLLDLEPLLIAYLFCRGTISNTWHAHPVRLLSHL